MLNIINHQENVNLTQRVSTACLKEHLKPKTGDSRCWRNQEQLTCSWMTEPFWKATPFKRNKLPTKWLAQEPHTWGINPYSICVPRLRLPWTNYSDILLRGNGQMVPEEYTAVKTKERFTHTATKTHLPNTILTKASCLIGYFHIRPFTGHSERAQLARGQANVPVQRCGRVRANRTGLLRTWTIHQK